MLENIILGTEKLVCKRKNEVNFRKWLKFNLSKRISTASYQIKITSFFAILHSSIFFTQEMMFNEKYGDQRNEKNVKKNV